MSVRGASFCHGKTLLSRIFVVVLVMTPPTTHFIITQVSQPLKRHLCNVTTKSHLLATINHKVPFNCLTNSRTFVSCLSLFLSLSHVIEMNSIGKGKAFVSCSIVNLQAQCSVMARVMQVQAESSGWSQSQWSRSRPRPRSR